LIRQLQRGIGRLFGSGGGRGGRSGSRGAPIILVIAVGLIVWAVWPNSGWYQVGPAQQGVVLRFGAFHRSTPPGFALKLPYPIEQVLLPNVQAVNRIEIGDNREGVAAARRTADSESLMLTGDENIVDLAFTVQWRVNTAQTTDYLFNLDDVNETIRAVSEAAMREVIGQTALQPIISNEIAAVENRVQEKIQETLDAYQAGVTVAEVAIVRPALPEADNPADRGNVERDPRAAFLDVENAEQEKQESIQIARAYANRVIPEARGAAQATIEAANGYRDGVVAEAAGDAERFNLIYDQYRLAPEVTRRRMFLETMEQVLQRADKVILDEGASGSGVVPYLPLNELNRSSGSNTGGQR
jgi:membrane protease subunit HflK